MNILYFYTTPVQIWVEEKKVSNFKRIFWKLLSDGKYIGKIKNRLPHGHCKKNWKMSIICPNGDSNEGTFKNGNPSGKFNFTNALGIKVEIDFKRFKNPLKR